MPLRISKIIDKPFYIQKDLQKAADKPIYLESKPEPQKSTLVTKLLTTVGLFGALFLAEAGKNEAFAKAPKSSSTTTSKNTKPKPSISAAYSKLREIEGFEQRQKYLQEVLSKINPELISRNTTSEEPTAVDLFNKKYGYSLECMGIKKIEDRPFRFIFINNFTGQNVEPVRLSLSSKEILNTKSRDDVLELLEKELNEDKEDLKDQFSIWANPYEYDFPKGGQSVCMMALSLTNLPGMESDLVRALEIYNKHYEMAIEALCINKKHISKVRKLLEEKNIIDVPNVSTALKSSVLENLERVLKKSIDEKKSMVLFHYMFHGGKKGNIHPSNQDKKIVILPKEIAEVISKDYNGKPICEQIDITIFASSCYSGRQLDGIKEHFETRKEIPVKNLRIIAEAEYTTAYAGTTPSKASLVSDLMTDESAPTDYYSSWYREYLEYINNKGIKLRAPVGTYVHAIRFVDLMTKFDTKNKQNPVGVHYQNNPKENKTTLEYFTNAKEIIADKVKARINDVNIQFGEWEKIPHLLGRDFS